MAICLNGYNDVHDSDTHSVHELYSTWITEKLTIEIWTPDALVTRARGCSEIFPDYHRIAGESGSHEKFHLMWQEEWFRLLTFFALSLYLDLAGGNNYKAPETREDWIIQVIGYRFQIAWQKLYNINLKSQGVHQWIMY